jgi:hypothetical protein
MSLLLLLRPHEDATPPAATTKTRLMLGVGLAFPILLEVLFL